ncbi:MAG: calcineurin-like phosphoesterase C-terminal domain-containing protein, partial [Bacteroidales bacterium]|nr:calcineurin-like phosphoesterase C-terminal domain-containing protein [Bacteroidales bacterium]
IEGLRVSDGFTFTKTDHNGYYQFELNPKARFVWVVIPSAYEIPLSASGNPLFYKTVDPSLEVNVNDFTLTPLAEGVDRNKFQMVMIGDPQCSTNTEVGYYSSQTINDIKTFLNGKGYFNSFAVTLGDNTFDSNDTYPGLASSMSYVKLSDGDFLPFFKAMGNHDHNGLASIDDCTKMYESYFGPTDFSFDRGNAHIIVMDDVFVTSTLTKNTSRSNKITCEYTYGFTEDEWKWIQEDIANVENPEDKLLIFCAHIPFRSYTTNHISDLLRAFTLFKEAHIMTGHSHYSQNWIHKNYVCAGGKAIYEHVHSTACGAWWATSGVRGSDVIGGPRGYSVYQVDGNKIVDWIMKGTGQDENFQLRVYDGNQEYTGAKNYPTYWYKTTTCGTAGISIKGNSNLKDCFVAQVWDDDDQYWTVELYQNGTKVGNFKRLANSSCANAAVCGWWFNEKGKNSTSYSSTYSSHYWYYKHTSLPTETTGWEVRATHKFPNGGSKTFTCNSLTTDYTTFYK